MTAQSIRGIHVFWAVAVFFAVTVGVEAFFVVRAVATFPGEDAPDSYVQGLDYNSTLARREEQRRLGWQAQAGLEAGSTLVVRIERSAGEPVRDLEVFATARTGGAANDSEAVQLTERSPGEYAAPVALGESGKFEISIEARRQGEASAAFEASKTLVIQ